MQVLAITLPIFLLIALGYAVAARGMFTPAQVQGFGRLVLMLALPALVFRALMQERLEDLLEWRCLAVYAIGSAVMLAGGYAHARIVARQGAAPAAMRGFGMSMSNSGFIGLPLAVQLMGPRAAVAMALIFVVENLVVIPGAMALAESGGTAPGRRRGPLPILAGLIRSPLLLAVAAAAVMLVAKVRPPAAMAHVIAMLADASAPVALLAIGCSLVDLSPRGLVRPVLGQVAGKMLLHPLAVLLATAVIPIVDPVQRHTLLLVAAVSSPSIYPVLARRYGDAPVASAAMLVGTIACFPWISLVVLLIRSGVVG